MSKQVDRLTDRTCRAAGVGRHHDGRGLYLACRQGVEGTTKSWLPRYTLNGKSTWMGLGPFPDVGLAQARRKAQDARTLKADGQDPLQAKRAVRAAAVQRAPSSSVTFAECAAAYIKSHDAAWSRAHAEQWVQSLRDYVYPVLGSIPVEQIDTAAVLRALQPIWAVMPETASRVRSRIELVLDFARVHGHRSGDNPAVWRGNLDHVLASPRKLRAVEHYAALHYRDVPALMAQLREREGIAVLALQFVCLTATRASETLEATWQEFDLPAKLWVIPARRMKGRREHRVPLNDAAIEMLRKTGTGSGLDDRPFPISLGALTRLRRRIGMSQTVHGLRSSFRVWCAEWTSFPPEIAEQCLAHVTGSAVEQAYQRSDLLVKRAELMQSWADYVTATATVLPLRAAS